MDICTSSILPSEVAHKITEKSPLPVSHIVWHILHICSLLNDLNSAL